MSKYVVTSPVRIQRAKIIPADQVSIKKTKYKLPIITIDGEYLEDFASQNSEAILDSDIKEIEEKERKEAELLEMSLRKPILKEEFSISNLDTPVEISLEKLSKYSIPLEEVEKQVQEAYDKGYNDGHQIASSTMQGEIETNQKWIRRIDEVVEDLTRNYNNEIKQLHETLPKLGATIAKHILEREIFTDRNIVIEQTQKAIESLDDEFIFKILLNPEDVEILRQSKSKLMHDSSALEKVILAADNTVEKGFCILETSTGKVDARLDTQLEKIKLRLEEKVEDILSETDFNSDSIEKDKQISEDSKDGNSPTN